MVKTKRGFVLATSFASGTALLLSIVSLATEQWVTAQGEFTLDTYQNEKLSTIKYGLFSGTFIQELGGTTYFEIKMTCWISNNVCGYICESSSEERLEQLKKLFRKDNVAFNTGCPKVPRSNFVYGTLKDTARNTRADDDREFLNAGLYIATLLFLSISILFGAVATVLAVWNTAANPYEVYLSIYGIYVYNGIACTACIFTLILWGSQFGITIVNNVGIFYTIINKMDSSGLAYLGFSYWLIVPSCLLYATSIVILYMRQFLINQEPEIKIHTTTGDKDVAEIMIY